MHGDLRAGDWVEVLSKEEILRTLDANGRLDSLPFMPEMFAFCGRRLRVFKSAHKTCDTIGFTGSRRVSDAVHLEGARCDGRSHGGCDAACMLFWKVDWLKRVDGSRAAVGSSRHGDPICTEEVVNTRAVADGTAEGGGAVFVCQATELVRASKPLRTLDVRQYVKDYQTKNVDARQLRDGFSYLVYSKLVRKARGPDSRVGRALIALYDRVQKFRGGRAYPRKRGFIPAGQRTPTSSLGLKPGDWVRVKPYAEILKTLDTNNKNRGLYFDAEHVPFCNRSFRVRSVVNRIIDEKTGKMLELKGNSVILDGAWCQSGYSEGRIFCPRAIYPYWREIWLERAEPPQSDAPAAEACAVGGP